MVRFTNIPWNPYGYYLSERPKFTLDPLLHAGAYYVQEAGSQFLWQALAQLYSNDDKINVLDLCAAPGGKSTLLASFFPDGLITANEVIKSRANILEENVTKWGSGNIVVTNNDPIHFQHLQGFYDLLVIDAPCSGSGLFRKDVKSIEEWSLENVTLCSKRQQRIIHDTFATLKKNGYFIYATCSYSTAENEDIVDYILSNFDTTSVQIPIEENWGIIETISSQKKGFGYRFFPHCAQSEGFFMAVFQKNTADYFCESKITGWTHLSSTEQNIIADWVSTQQYAFIKNKEKIIAIPKEHEAWIQHIRQHLYFKKTGIEIGEIKNKGLVPSHALAVSTIPMPNVPRLELTIEQALQYLRKEAINGLTYTYQGWTLVTYQATPLGWIKLLPNRYNNYYPTEWRILMR